MKCLISLVLILLLLAGCAAGPASSGRPAAAAGSSASQTASSASAENTSESAASSEASPALVEWDADGALVIPPEMFEWEKAANFYADESPAFFESHLEPFQLSEAKRSIQYYFGPHNLPAEDFCKPSEADPLYLAGSAIDYASWVACDIPAPYCRPRRVENADAALECFAEAGYSPNNTMTQEEFQAALQVLFGDDFAVEDRSYLGEMEGGRNGTIVYLPEEQLYGYNDAWAGPYYGYPCIILGSCVADSLHCTVALCEEGYGVDNHHSVYYLEREGKRVYYSDRYAAVFRALLFEGDLYELRLAREASDGRYTLRSLHRLEEAEKERLAEEVLS